MCDDVFDEEADDEKIIGENEWKKRMDRIEKAGFREGLDEGKAFAAQKGFDAGFHASYGNVCSLNILKGIISALGAGLKSNHFEDTFFSTSTPLSTTSSSSELDEIIKLGQKCDSLKHQLNEELKSCEESSVDRSQDQASLVVSFEGIKTRLKAICIQLKLEAINQQIEKTQLSFKYD